MTNKNKTSATDSKTPKFYPPVPSIDLRSHARAENSNEKEDARSRSHTQKLTRQAQLEVLRYLALGHSGKWIADKILELYGISITPQSINEYKHRKESARMILALYNRIVKGLAKNPIKEKSYRLRVMQEALAEARNEGDHKAVSMLTDRAQEEVEGKKGGIIINNVQQNFGTLSPAKTKKLSPEELNAELVNRLQGQFSRDQK